MITFATQNSDGFSSFDIALLRAVLPALRVTAEVIALNNRVATVLKTYVGREPQKYILAGEIRRGEVMRIRSAILQVLVNLLDCKMDVENAVAAPRIHYEDGLTYIEGGFSAETLQAILKRYPQHRTWNEQNMFFGGVHTVVAKDNKFSGAGDLRRGGVFINV